MWSQMDEELHLDHQTPEHRELMTRLRKTLYFGGLKMPCKVLSRPLSDLVATDAFIDTHPPYSLKPETVGQIKAASPCSLILALVYLDLLKELDPQYVRRVSPSELLLVAMMVSTKFYSGYDENVYISEWAEFGKVTVDRLKTLELEFLDAMDWKIYVSNATFFKKLKQIERILAERETTTRGWLTYTELCTLMPSIEAIRKVLSYSALLAVSYTAGVIAIAGAFFVASQVPGSYLYNRGTGQSTVTSSSPSGNSSTGSESVASCVVVNEISAPPTTIVADLATECRPGGACIVAGREKLNYSELTELEKRLILAGVEWEPVSTADKDGTQIHMNRGTDYWTMNTASGVVTTTVTSDGFTIDMVENSAAHGTIRRIENETTTNHEFAEWQPFQRCTQNDLSFLSYLWLKFL